MSSSTHRRPVRFVAAAALVAGLLGPLAAAAQQAFSSTEAAAQAFRDAIANNDVKALEKVLGRDWRRFVPRDEIGQGELQTFLAAWDKKHSVVSTGQDKAALAVGDGGWTLPIPLVMSGGSWRFDPSAGADEMRTRRIGSNELNAMQAVLAYFDAQKEYAQRDRDGDGVLSYAQKFASTPGRRDGLYWAADAQGESPLGPRFSAVKPGEGYYGYHYKILTAQGKDAPGGAYDYVIGNRMRAGFALVAWPIHYGDTGVTSFMISHDGVLYQKDLGPDSAAIAKGMKAFNPDSSWSKVSVP
ncbi:DUF2950 domain-containing protein [Variovorax sp. OV329]|uniref:DUF2950 domain-containing protein n=1 Tax=Variovorax sp. OV329 TaxID=1882825 RepID=UPI0008E097CA|nr:DUF2950 domain-containing protein [Variovorax sp. OV329]SFM42159.1 Protein of unknown function [Variovorax sp. OV329]